MYRPEEVLIPRNVDEITAILAQHPEDARVIAGNTMMFEVASRGLASDVKILVDITQAGLAYINEQQDGIHIGAATTLTELAQAPALLRSPRDSVVAETAMKITPVQIRNVATIGGEICSAIPFFDLPPSLLTLDAQVKLRDKRGERTLPLREFTTDFLTTAIHPDELLTEIVLPKADQPSGAAFVKLGRTASDLAVVNVAASVSLDSLRRCQSASIWLGGVAPTFRRSPETEALLVGTTLDKEAITKAAGAAANFEPTPSIHASAEYKKLVIPVLIRDCVQAAHRKAGP